MKIFSLKLYSCDLINQDFILHCTTNAIKFVNQENEFIIHEENGVINNYYLDDQNIWTLTDRGAYQTQVDKKDIRKFNKTPFFPELSISCMIKDRENNYWLGTRGQGIYIVPSLSFLHYNETNSPLNDSKIFSIHVDHNNRVLLGQNDNQLNVLEEGKKIKTINLGSKGRILSIYQDTKNRFIIGGDQNLNILDENFNKLLTNQQGGNKMIISDHDLNLWIAQSKGIAFAPNDPNPNKVYPEINNAFRYTYAPSSKIILPTRTYALFEDFDQTMWLGSTQGI